MLFILFMFYKSADSWSFLTPTRYGINEGRFEKCPSSAEPQRSREGNIIWCKNNSECAEYHTCTAIEGLLHFDVQIRYCCPIRMSTCLLPPQPGYGDCGKKPKKMFYFDATRLQCQRFEVLECLGTNDNRFSTAEECVAQCERTVCKPGESLLIKDEEIRLCGTEPCPVNYVCRYDALFRRHVCCGYSNIGACAVGYRSYMSANEGVPFKCNVNYVKDECPADFLCASSAESVNSYCCSLEDGVCPLGQAPYYHPLTSKTVKCNPSSGFSDCPAGFTCSATVVGAIWGFCCSQQVTAQCPQNSVPYFYPLTGQPQKCTIGVTICRTGFACMNKSPKSLIGFCCTVISTAANKPSVIKQPNRKPNENTFLNRLSTIAPLLYKKKQLRLVDIQKEIDRQNMIKDKKLKSLAPYGGFRSTGDEMDCPPTHRRVFQEDGFPIECHLFKKCPATLECISPKSGFMEKSICCERKQKLDDEYEEPNAYAGEYELSLSSTSDPYCPTVIENRYCIPEDPNYCRETGFFCQFNIIRQEFMCCSISSHLAIRRDVV